MIALIVPKLQFLFCRATFFFFFFNENWTVSFSRCFEMFSEDLRPSLHFFFVFFFNRFCFFCYYQPSTPGRRNGPEHRFPILFPTVFPPPLLYQHVCIEQHQLVLAEFPTLLLLQLLGKAEIWECLERIKSFKNDSHKIFASVEECSGAFSVAQVSETTCWCLLYFNKTQPFFQRVHCVLLSVSPQFMCM